MSDTHETEEDLLQAALSSSSAFTPTHIRRQSAMAPKPDKPTVANPPPETPAVESESGRESLEDWREEYDANVSSWKAQSAEAREKAEKERIRWEGIRAAEQEELERKKALGLPVEEEEVIVDQVEPVQHGWESVGASASSVSVAPSSPSPVDGRDLVTGEPEQKQAHFEPALHDSVSDKWEKAPENPVSFPNLDSPAERPAQLSATMAIFDTSLPTGARVRAIAASLAVNMLLPFINGVFLGFGELFARNVVLPWWGRMGFWGGGITPKRSVTKAGL